MPRPSYFTDDLSHKCRYDIWRCCRDETGIQAAC